MIRNQATMCAGIKSPLPPAKAPLSGLIRGRTSTGWFVILGGLIALALTLWGCGDPPQAPTEQRGNLIARGVLPNGNLADSIHIILDFDTLGYRFNPDTLQNLWAGTHQVLIRTSQGYHDSLHYIDTTLNIDTVVYVDTTFLEFLSTPNNVLIVYNQTTVNTCSLTAILPAFPLPQAPYVGWRAPYFSTYDLDSNLVCLDSLAGKVALLYFWSFT